VPPDPGNLLFDWDPTWDPIRDRVAGIGLTKAGDAQLANGNNGLLGLLVSGSGALLGRALFSSVDDLSGDRFTVYVVCEFTGAGTTVFRSVWGMGDDSASANQQEAVSIYMIESSNATVVNSADEAGAQFDVGGIQTRDTVQVLHADVSISGSLIMNLDGATGGGTALTATPHTPENMDKMAIGTGYTFANNGTSPETLGTGWVGYVHRVLIYRGAFNAAVVAAA